MATGSRRWLAIVAGAAVLLAIAAIALRVQVTIPSDAATVPIAHAVLAGPVEPDPTDGPVPSDGSAPAPPAAATTPWGQACLNRLSSGSGWLDLCWDAYRLGADADPQKDYYVLRLHGSHEGLRWLVIRSQLVGTPGDRVYDVWPDGTYEGACRQEPVTLPLLIAPVAPGDVCGRTEAVADFDQWSHRLAWTCEACLVTGTASRGLEMYAVVGMPEGIVPSWDLFASAGS